MNITPLEEGREFEILKTLSEGIPFLLENTEATFLDTSFLCNGIISFNDYDCDELLKYERSTKNGNSQVDILSLLRLQHEYALGQANIDIDLVKGIIWENIHRSSKLLDTLEDLATEDDFFISDTVNYETSQLYRSAKKYFKNYKQNKPFKKYKNHAKTNRKSKRDARKSRIVERELFDQYKGITTTEGIEEQVKKNLTRLSNLLTTFELNGKIIPSSDTYPPEREFCDHRIIDTAMAHPVEKIGILTNDMHFIGKVNDVRLLRNNRKLPVPVTFLITSVPSLEGYDSRIYMKESPFYSSN